MSIFLIYYNIKNILINYINNKKIAYADCGEYFSSGFRKNGVYEIKPLKDSDVRINVHCNMEAGGWTTLMSRNANSKYEVDWQLKLEGYKYGFGNLDGDHFLGLDNFNMLTSEKDRQLMIVLNETQYKIRHFKVLNEYFNYKLIVDKEIDRLPDDSSILRLNNTLFSTIDVDFDLAVNSNCSSGWKAGWWFTDCFDKSTCLTCLIMHGSKGVKKLHYAGMLLK